jgi:hypothetical protein
MATRRSSKPVKPYGAYVAAGDVWHDKDGERIGKPVEVKPADDKSAWREVARRVRPEWNDEQFNAAWDSFIEFRRQMCLS